MKRKRQSEYGRRTIRPPSRLRSAKGFDILRKMEHVVRFLHRGRNVMKPRAEDHILMNLHLWGAHYRSRILHLLAETADLDFAYLDSWLDPLARETGDPIRTRWEELRPPRAAQKP